MDRRTKNYQQCLNLTIAISCLILGGILNQLVVESIKAKEWGKSQANVGMDCANNKCPSPAKTFWELNQETSKSIGQEEVQTKTKSVEELIREVFGKDSDRALQIARCESGLKSICNDGVNSNGSVDCGIFQINSIHGISRKFLLNPEINIRVAYQIFTEQGNFSAWVCDRKV